jgi:hypothetical protein
MKTVLFVLLTLTGIICSQTAEKITFKELQAAKELYEKGSIGQAAAIIEALKNDKDKKLGEQAWYLKMTLLNDFFVPVRFMTEPASSIVSHYISSQGENFKKFKNKFKKSKYNQDIEKSMDSAAKEFTAKMEGWKNYINVSLSDSCSFEHKADSTFRVEFKVSLSKSDEDIFRMIYSGKLTRYEPWGDMKDEWGSTGLLLDADGKITFMLDSTVIKTFDAPVEIKQYPEYVLRRVTEFGFSQEKTFIREDNSEQIYNIASFLNENIAVSNMSLRLLQGKMHELVPYYSDNPDSSYPKNFRSKAYLDLMMYVK